MTGVFMACGHTTHATRDDKPVCVICAGIKPGAYDTVDVPELVGRVMVCSYGHSPKGDRPSSEKSAFFQHRPAESTDLYYCGCFGWD